jgi:hypothetical protein
LSFDVLVHAKASCSMCPSMSAKTSQAIHIARLHRTCLCMWTRYSKRPLGLLMHIHSSTHSRLHVTAGAEVFVLIPGDLNGGLERHGKLQGSLCVRI